MIQFIYYVFFIFTLVYGTYFLISGFFAFKNMHKPIIKKHKPKNKFAILVASRNEEAVIGELVESLLEQDYPKDLYEVIVIPNNCTDNTEKVAKKAGATIMKCTVPVKSKGEVLKFAFEKLSKRKDIDAYIVFDADNIVKKDYLTHMNSALCDGYRVAQCFRDSKNASDNWLSGSYSIFYWVQNFFFNKARMQMGGSSSINGTGFMIKKDVIDEFGFNTVTLTEDVEFTAMCAINNEKIGFATDAITYDEQTNSFDVSWKQRKRWSFGTMECLREYFPTLLKKGIKERNFECFDVGLFYLSVISHVVFNLLPIFLLINIIIHFDSLTFDNMLYKIIFIVISYLFGVVVRIILLKRYNKSFKDNIGGVLLFDLFVFSWLPINFICLFIKSCNWDSIKHNRSVDIENV